MSKQKIRIPKDVRISELIDWAAQMGCAVEIRLVEKKTRQAVSPEPPSNAPDVPTPPPPPSAE